MYCFLSIQYCAVVDFFFTVVLCTHNYITARYVVLNWFVLTQSKSWICWIWYQFEYTSTCKKSYRPKVKNRLEKGTNVLNNTYHMYYCTDHFSVHWLLSKKVIQELNQLNKLKKLKAYKYKKHDKWRNKTRTTG